MLAQSAPGAPRQTRVVTREEMMMIEWRRANQDGVVANVDGSIITSYDIRKGVSYIAPQIVQESKSEADLQQRFAKATNEIKESLADQQILISEFKDTGGFIPPSHVQSEVERRIQKDFNGDRALFLDTLQRRGMTILDYRKDIEENIIVDHMRGRIYRPTTEISPAQIEKYYEENKDRFMQPGTVHFRQITLYPSASQTDADVRNDAATIIAALKSGADFGELAKKYSKDDFRNDGGDAGTKEIEKLNEKIADALRAAGAGGVTEPLDLTMPGGRVTLFIFKCEEYRPAGLVPIEDVRDAIENQISNDQRLFAQQEWMERLRKKYFVRYY